MNIIQMINVSPLVTISIIALTIDLTILVIIILKQSIKKLLRLFVAVLFIFLNVYNCNKKEYHLYK